MKHELLRLKELYKVRMFENRALKELFVQNGGESNKTWEKTAYGRARDVNSSPDIIRLMV